MCVLVSLFVAQTDSCMGCVNSPILTYLTVSHPTKCWSCSTEGPKTQWATTLSLLQLFIELLKQWYSWQGGIGYFVEYKLAAALQGTLLATVGHN